MALCELKENSWRELLVKIRCLSTSRLCSSDFIESIRKILEGSVHFKTELWNFKWVKSTIYELIINFRWWRILSGFIKFIYENSPLQTLENFEVQSGAPEELAKHLRLVLRTKKSGNWILNSTTIVEVLLRCFYLKKRTLIEASKRRSNVAFREKKPNFEFVDEHTRQPGHSA